MSNLISQLQTQQGAFDFVEDIIKDIKDGNRLHEQSDYHTVTDCGTAHCIAGWIDNDIMSSIGQELHITKGKRQWESDRKIRIESIIKQYFNEEIYYRYSCLMYASIWSLATALLGVTDVESSLLFETKLSINEIENNFHKLKEIYNIK